jgi:hypothetical protein
LKIAILYFLALSPTNNFSAVGDGVKNVRRFRRGHQKMLSAVGDIASNFFTAVADSAKKIIFKTTQNYILRLIFKRCL